MPDAFETEFLADPHALRLMTAEMRRFLVEAGIAARPLYAAELALEELVTNVMLHGHEDSVPHRVRVRVSTTGDHVLLRVEDDGRPFDWA